MDIDDTVRTHDEVFFDSLSTFVVDNSNSSRDMVQMLREDWGPTLWDAWTDPAAIDLSHTRDKSDVVTTMGSAALHNTLLHRTILMFTSLQLELQTLADEGVNELIPPLCLYGADITIRDDDAARGLGKMLPHLMDVWNWHDRVKKVVLRTIHQLSRTFSAQHERDKLAPFQAMRLPSLWNTLYDVLGAVSMIDEVLSRHDMAQRSAVILSRVLERVRAHPEKHEDVNVDYVEQSARLLSKLDRELLHRGLLGAVVLQDWDCPECMVTPNEALFNIAAEHLMDSTILLTELIAQFRERKEERRRVIGVAAAFYWFCTVFDARLSIAPHMSLRNKLSEQLFALQKVSPVVPIYGDSSMKIGQWLSAALPRVIGQAIKEPTREALAAVKETLMKKRKLLVEGTKQYRRDVAQWVSLMRSTYSHERTRSKGMIRMMTLLLVRGVFLAQYIQRLIHDLFALHVAAGEGMQRSMVENVLTLVSMLMTIRNTVHAKSSSIATLFSLICQCQAFAMQRDLFELQNVVQKKLQAQSATSSSGGGKMTPLQTEALTDQLCAIQQAYALLGQPATRQNLATLDIALSIVFRRRDLLEEMAAKADNVFRLMTTLRDIATFQKRLIDATDCAVLYWQPECLPTFFKTVYDRPALSQELIFLIQALQDARDPLLRGKHDSPESLLSEFEKTVEEHLEKQILHPLLNDIEIDLRLHIHAGVRGMPYKQLAARPKDIARLCRLPPMLFFNKVLNISHRLEDRLDRMFYDLNALNPTDWKAYDEMRTLATKKYGLHLLEGHLPGSIVDQGLDVLVITKNIHVFIAHYAYNLNEQVFIQRPQLTEAKQLNALHIRHVANSIRTHGTGIMSTTVHYVFKCLLKKLNVLSEFLYDDVIKSKLLKEMKLFEQYKEKLNRRFSFERAEKFNTDMRNIGSTEDGKSYLDRFRQVVTEVGNALGYVRMVRSGGLRSVSDAAVAIPDLENVPLLEKCFNPKAKRPDEEEKEKKEGEGDEFDLDEEEEEEEEEDEDSNNRTIAVTTADSVKIVDAVVHGMTKKLSDGSDYFRMLTEALGKRLADTKKYAHLKNFHVIIPPMAISFVAMLVNQKEKLTKKNKDGLFCDDGFALGCSFLLSLFRLEQNFDSLHWFDSAIHHLRTRRARETEELAESRDQKSRSADDSDTFAADSIQLSIAVLDQSIQEYMALHHAFNSCRVFFTQKKKDAEEEDEEDEEGGGGEASATAASQ